MDDSGNILVKRIAKSNVYVKLTSEENAIASDILKLPNGQLESEKPVKLFDMKKFQQNVSREMRRAYPDRRKLECQCISAIAFVRNENDILDCPCWIMLINIVAMDMLKSKMPPSKYLYTQHHSSEKRRLCLMKSSSETLQNLPYFMYTKPQSCFFHFSFCATLFPP